MRQQDDRDRAIEKLLRRSRPGASTPSTPCVDGETLAAWSDGSLSTSDAVAVDAHLVTCAACQSMAAAFARAAPAGPPRPSFFGRWHMRWVLPLATAATAVALWVAVPDRGSQSLSPESPRSSVSAPVEASPSELPPAVAPDAPRRSAAQRLDDRPQMARPPAPRTAASQPSASDLADRAEPPESSRDRQAPELGNVQREPDGAATPRDAAAPATFRQETANREELAKTSSAAVAEALRAPPNSLPAEVGPARAETKPKADAAAAMAPAAPLAERLDRRRSQPAETRSALGWSSPDGQVRWRLIAGRLERATAGGAAWVPVALDRSVGVMAGAAPSPLVCWLVGKEGAVLLSRDGQAFSRLSFPERVDVVAIQATDGDVAIVTTADGRSFGTSDGGATWRRGPRQ